MRNLAALAFMATALISSPAHACVSTSPHAAVWSQCAYKVAYAVKEHNFLKNFALAKTRKEKLLDTAEPRWAKLEPRIVKACGSFEKAVNQDKALGKKMPSGRFIPDNQFKAMANTYNIDKLVKS
jgi:hypothetical protein